MATEGYEDLPEVWRYNQKHGDREIFQTTFEDHALITSYYQSNYRR